MDPPVGRAAIVAPSKRLFCTHTHSPTHTHTHVHARRHARTQKSVRRISPSKLFVFEVFTFRYRQLFHMNKFTLTLCSWYRYDTKHLISFNLREKTWIIAWQFIWNGTMYVYVCVFLCVYYFIDRKETYFISSFKAMQCKINWRVPDSNLLLTGGEFKTRVHICLAHSFI